MRPSTSTSQPLGFGPSQGLVEAWLSPSEQWEGVTACRRPQEIQEKLTMLSCVNFVFVRLDAKTRRAVFLAPATAKSAWQLTC